MAQQAAVVSYEIWQKYLKILRLQCKDFLAVWAPGSAAAEVSYQVSGSLGLKLGLQVGLNDGCSGQWRIQGGGRWCEWSECEF